MVSKVTLWHIYFAPNCFHSQPIKDKFVIPVCINGEDYMGFLINSHISNFIQNRPELLTCQASIGANEHRPLKKDSIVDCHSLYPFRKYDFEMDRGRVSQVAQKNIINAVYQCPTIKRKLKRLILEGFEELIDKPDSDDDPSEHSPE